MWYRFVYWYRSGLFSYMIQANSVPEAHEIFGRKIGQREYPVRIQSVTLEGDSPKYTYTVIYRDTTDKKGNKFPYTVRAKSKEDAKRRFLQEYKPKLPHTCKFLYIEEHIKERGIDDD